MTTPTVEELLREGEALLRGGERERARAILSQAVRSNPRSEQAWLLLAGAVTDPEQRRTCLERVLRLNPGHAVARKVIATLPPPAAPLMAPTEPRGTYAQQAQVAQPAPVRPAVGPAEVVAVPAQPVGPAREQSPPRIPPATPAAPVRAAVGPTEAVTRPEQLVAPPAPPAILMTPREAPPAAPPAQALVPPVAPTASTVVDTIRLERDRTIALSDDAVRRAAADRLLWQVVLALGIVLMLAGAAMAGVVLLAG